MGEEEMSGMAGWLLLNSPYAPDAGDKGAVVAFCHPLVVDREVGNLAQSEVKGSGDRNKRLSTITDFNVPIKTKDGVVQSLTKGNEELKPAQKQLQ